MSVLFHISSFYIQVRVSNKRQKVFMNETITKKLFVTEYPESCQTSKMERFAKIVNLHNQGSEYASILQCLTIFTSIKYLIICFIVKYVVTERHSARGSKCVTWNYWTQILHFPSGIIESEQVNATWVIINQMRYNASKIQCTVQSVRFPDSLFFKVFCYDCSSFVLRSQSAV